MTGSTILSVTTCVQVALGMGSHTITIDPATRPETRFWYYIAMIVYNAALGFVKISVLLQCLRIFPRSVQNGPLNERLPRNKYRTATHILLAAVSFFTAGAVLSWIFTCLPVQKFWHSDLPGTCLAREAYWGVIAGINIVTGICVAVLPLPVLHSLRIPRRQRHLLMITFGLAGITVVVSILRLPFLYIFSTSDDPYWHSPMVSIMSSLEVNSGIIASCIPTLKALLSQYFPALSKEETQIASEEEAKPNRNGLEEHAMEDLSSRTCSQRGDPSSSVRGSTETATHLNATYFNATPRLDD
ncbi:uncharacterized protein RCC_01695 [Ramularia collo-cygni]|uniref:Rhodopsin domain-containing protein n=1 Tax=Ramularia collo-cygni TaxID=112498 RepID=A0A2D3V2X5_9PEZI|nr:uncharacterized protein RCC_01695 [Ramularia collo-cygni]CZT15859.1 uncharacterized protein RCC_01695 [Ramularia collo-cygni]